MTFTKFTVFYCCHYVSAIPRYPSSCQVHPEPRSSKLYRRLSVITDQADIQKKDLAYHLTEHLRVNGVYWGLTALCIMGHQDALSREEMIEYVLSCWDDEAGMSLLVLLKVPKDCITLLPILDVRCRTSGLTIPLVKP